MNKPLLSICIPTYNRADFLPTCIESIVVQFKNAEVLDKVEIVISDNGSTDNTEEVVKSFQKKYPNIFYRKNAINLGYDKNALELVPFAKGEYCWMLGDDDALFEGSLAYVLNILTKHKFGYLMANAWGYDHQLIKPVVSKPNLHISKDLEFSKLSDFVKSIDNYTNLVGYFGGLSCQIFKREVWLSLSGKDEFVGTQTIHLYIILKGAKDLPACVVAKPLVKVRADNIRWDSFPGLETVTKRARSTQEGMLWIFNLYGIKYSKLKLWSSFYWGVAYSFLLTWAKKTFLKNQRIKVFLKKLMGV